MIEVVEVSVRRPYQDEAGPMPLVVLTEQGRAHLRDNTDNYRRTYPELSLP